MTPAFRTAGTPSPLATGTHDDDRLAPAIPFDADRAGAPEPIGVMALAGEIVDLGADAPRWLTFALRSIRPLCIGALMAIPTVGAASVGTVALFSPARADAMVIASTAFLRGIPADVLILIGTLASGYGLAKTVERLRGTRP